jgi:hypothetical protein
VPLDQWIGTDNTSYGYTGDGRVFRAGVAIATYSAWTTGDVIGACIKGGFIYFSKNGVWQNSADPSAGTGGIDVSANFTSAKAAVSLAQPNATITAAFTASSQAYAIPTGVTAWDGSTKPATGTTYNDTLAASAATRPTRIPAQQSFAPGLS